MTNNFTKMINNYDYEDFKSDLSAGLSVGAIALPQNMAYALIIGINPIYGLYTSIVSMVMATFFGISNYMIVGPTNIMAVALASSLNQFETGNNLQLVFLLTFLVGVIQLILVSLKLGKLVNYISHPVIVGLTTGVALQILIGQLNDFLGMTVNNGYNIIDTLYEILSNLDQINYYSLFVGILTLSIIIILKNINPKLPSYLISIVIPLLTVYIFDISDSLELVKQFSASLPDFNPPPILNLSLIKNLLSSALSIAILGFIQVISIVKSLEEKTREEVDLSREFI